MKEEPTKAAIKKQVAALRAIKPKVHRFTGFGDDNWALIDAQVEVLSKELDDGDIEMRYAGYDDQRSAAFQARQWLDGELEDAPDLVSEWKKLVR